MYVFIYVSFYIYMYICMNTHAHTHTQTFTFVPEKALLYSEYLCSYTFYLSVFSGCMSAIFLQLINSAVSALAPSLLFTTAITEFLKRQVVRITLEYQPLNPADDGQSGQYKMTQKNFKMTETLAHGYLFESAQRELSNEYQHDRV